LPGKVRRSPCRLRCSRIPASRRGSRHRERRSVPFPHPGKRRVTQEAAGLLACGSRPRGRPSRATIRQDDRPVASLAAGPARTRPQGSHPGLAAHSCGGSRGFRPGPAPRSRYPGHPGSPPRPKASGRAAGESTDSARRFRGGGARRERRTAPFPPRRHGLCSGAHPAPASPPAAAAPDTIRRARQGDAL
jgi:hypothetical protein